MSRHVPTRSILTLGVFCVAVAWSPPARAVKYMSIGQAVKTFIPKGDKIMKVTKKLGSKQKQRLAQDYGWTSQEAKYVFYVGKRNDEPTSYVFIVPEIFNTCFHKYAVGMKPDGEVIETVIVELSCPRAFPINRKSFLKQFTGKEHHDALTIESDIDAVTGATLSSEATATAARKAVSLHNLFFGGERSVQLASSVRRARAKAAGMIQKAIETGETTGGAAQLEE